MHCFTGEDTEQLSVVQLQEPRDVLPEALTTCADQCGASENTVTQTSLQTVCSHLGKAKPRTPFSGSPELALQGPREG